MQTMTASAQTGGPVPFSGPADASIPQEHRTQALLSWLLMFVLGFISPLLFFFISADKPFVKYHASIGLAATITSFVVVIGMVFVGVILGMISPALAIIVMLLYMVFGLAMLALVIMGAIAGNAGSTFSPPLVSNVAKAIFKV
jgi:uncharacterized membrane protein